MTRVLAFDQATTSGWAFGTEKDRAVFGRFTMPSRPDHERLFALYKFALAKAAEFEPDLIAYETPYFPLHDLLARPKAGGGALEFGADSNADPASPGRRRAAFNPKTVKWLQKVEGALMMVAAELSIPLEDYSSAAWRGTFLGFSRAPKGSDADFLKRAAFQKAKMLGYDVTSKDEADVLGILFHALHGEPGSRRKQGDLLALAIGGLSS